MQSLAGWLSGLSTSLLTNGLLVGFPVRAHAWVAGQVLNREHVRGDQSIYFSHRCFSPSLSSSLPLSLKVKKIKS